MVNNMDVSEQHSLPELKCTIMGGIDCIFPMYVHNTWQGVCVIMDLLASK